jgi:hypothetical protein
VHNNGEYEYLADVVPAGMVKLFNTYRPGADALTPLVDDCEKLRTTALLTDGQEELVMAVLRQHPRVAALLAQKMYRLMWLVSLKGCKRQTWRGKLWHRDYDEKSNSRSGSILLSVQDDTRWHYSDQAQVERTVTIRAGDAIYFPFSTDHAGAAYLVRTNYRFFLYVYTNDHRPPPNNVILQCDD